MSQALCAKPRQHALGKRVAILIDELGYLLVLRQLDWLLLRLCPFLWLACSEQQAVASPANAAQGQADKEHRKEQLVLDRYHGFLRQRQCRRRDTTRPKGLSRSQ